MDLHALILTCVTVISVSGQFVEIGYTLDSAPLPIRRRFSTVSYEIQPSISKEIKYQSIESEKTSNQGRRHVDGQHRSNSQYEQLSKNVNDFETKTSSNIRSNDDRRYNRDQNNGFRTQPDRQDYENVPKTNRNDDEVNTAGYNNKLKTNLDNPKSRQNVQTHALTDSHGTRENSMIGRSQPESYEIDKTTKTSATVKTYLSEDSYNQQPVTSNENLNNRQIARSYENSKTNINTDNVIYNKKHTETSDRRIEGNLPIQKNNSIKTNADNTGYYNSGIGDNRQNTENRRIYDNGEFENNRRSTETTWRNTLDDRSVTGGTKSTQDNELTSKTHDNRNGMKNDDPRIWKVENGTKKATIDPSLPSVDDRAAFTGDKCPTGQVRFNNMCVYKD